MQPPWLRSQPAASCIFCQPFLLSACTLLSLRLCPPCLAKRQFLENAMGFHSESSKAPCPREWWQKQKRSVTSLSVQLQFQAPKGDLKILTENETLRFFCMPIKLQFQALKGNLKMVAEKSCCDLSVWPFDMTLSYNHQATLSGHKWSFSLVTLPYQTGTPCGAIYHFLRWQDHDAHLTCVLLSCGEVRSLAASKERGGESSCWCSSCWLLPLSGSEPNMPSQWPCLYCLPLIGFLDIPGECCILSCPQHSIRIVAPSP